MAKVTSNRVAVVAGLKGFAGGFSLRGRGRTKSLGDDLADAIAQQIVDRTVLQQKDPSGRALAPLRPATLERKRRLGYPETIGVETKEMLSFAEVRGDVAVGADRMTMTYGDGDGAKVKGEWFQDPSNPAQAPRPFYGVDDRGNPDLDAAADAGLDAQAKALGAD